MLNANTMMVGRLKLRVSRSLPPRLVSASSRRIESFEPSSSRIPPAAILIIRRLRDPLPGCLHERGISRDNTWEDALQRRLNDVYGAAARPRFGSLPPDCDAVAFADEAEMLACLAADLASGNPFRHWWWLTLRGSLPHPLTLESLLLFRPAWIPAIVREVSTNFEGTQTLLSLPDDVTLRLLTAMLGSYSAGGRILHDLHLAAAKTTVNATAESEIAEALKEGLSDQRCMSTEEWGISPFARWLPLAETASVPWLQAMFVSWAIGLNAEPATTRSEAFESRVAEWFKHQHSKALDSSLLRSRSFTAAASEPQTLKTSEPSPSSTTPQDPMPVRPSSPIENPLAPDLVIDSNASQQDSGDYPGSGVLPARQQVSPQPLEADAKRPQIKANVREDSQQSSGRDIAAGREPILTDLGGTFFLINVLERLGMPQCFGADSWVARNLSRWALLELIARGLLAGEQPSRELDGLWPALRALDGRDELLPDFENPSLGPFSDAIPLIRHWIHQALDPMGSGSPEEAVTALLLLQAKVFVTRVTVDVVASVEDCRVDIRRAGLDMDPGWLPDYGRTIRFHYE